MGSSSSSKSRPSYFTKLLFRALVLVGLIWMFSSAGFNGSAKSASFVPESAANLRDGDVVTREKVVRPQLDINYMSKRRVPNGPDPIHNRRAGNSGRPPGQA